MNRNPLCRGARVKHAMLCCLVVLLQQGGFVGYLVLVYRQSEGIRKISQSLISNNHFVCSAEHIEQ